MNGPAALEPVREWVAQQIRARVVGDQPDEKAAAIFDAPGPRWFDEDRAIRRVHGDAAMFVGGLRALLLQSLHPLAMAGVAQHSDYRADPWGRLQRTADFLAATSFGNVAGRGRSSEHSRSRSSSNGSRRATVSGSSRRRSASSISAR